VRARLRVRGLQADLYRNMLFVQIIFENMCNNIMTFHNAVLLQVVEKYFEMLQEDLLTLVQMKFFIYLLWNIAVCINTNKKSVILLSWNWTGAKLSNIWIIRLYLYRPKFLQVIFCCCSYGELYNLSYSIWISPTSAGLGSSGYSSVFWSLRSWRSCWSKTKGVSRYCNDW
jgi:hypothetical protein